MVKRTLFCLTRKNMTTSERIVNLIAQDISAKDWQVQAVLDLFAEQATVPFIARYRKERTGGLDDAQLRLLEERFLFFKALEERRETIARSIEQQGKMTPEIEAALFGAKTKQALEDIYLPYRVKRRSLATEAKAANLEPLLDVVLGNPQAEVRTLAVGYVKADTAFSTVEDVLKGIRAIFGERITDCTELVSGLRQFVWENASLESVRSNEVEDAEGVFKDYYEYSEPISEIPSHRALALFRGYDRRVLTLSLREDDYIVEHYLNTVFDTLGLAKEHRQAGSWVLNTVQWAWRVKLRPSFSTDLFSQLREQAEKQAIDVFGTNLKSLLMAPPAGTKVVMGLDPGFRNGVKVAVVNAHGALVDTVIIYPFGPRVEQARAQIVAMAKRHQVELMAIGNGTASRETDAFVGEILREYSDLKAHKVIVSEAGASVYSASEVAFEEFPDVDVSYRGAISIARRLQDPLAELVKIDPKAIGVGQYQHDVNQSHLNARLNNVVEDCVNAVGVDVNTASVQILQRISGLGPIRARNIVEQRTKDGLFRNREQLRKVRGMGPKVYELSVGFLRINNGENALDSTSVHPESYSLVSQMLKVLGKPLNEVIGNTKLLKTLKLEQFVTPETGLPTLRDIVTELEKPGRDPREEFSYAQFSDDVTSIYDLKPGMKLEGVITNVAQFGAFVDIGVHQDGLVHISQLADQFVQDPHQIVKVGDIVQVLVLEVDQPRHRIALSMKRQPEKSSSDGRRVRSQGKTSSRRDEPQGAMANAFKRIGVC